MVNSNRRRRRYGHRSAIASGAVIGVVIAIIAIIAAGAYVALYGGKTTSFVTQTITGTGSGATVTQTVTQTGSAGVTTVTGTAGTSVVTITQSGTTLVTTLTATASQTFTATYPATLPAETITETGSSLLFPLFNDWVPNFTAKYSSIKIDTASTGSGTGQSSAETGAVEIGGSDAYLTNLQASGNPEILNIPLAISAQQVNYNVPGIPSTMHLNFSGPVLAGIYNGTITTWNSPYITALNPGAASLLTDQTIIPIHRADSSGDTFLFTQYLSFSTPSWNSSVGYGTTVSWPSVAASQAATGNGGMVQACNATKYSIAYIGVSYLRSAVADDLGYAYLQNEAGNFVNISSTNIEAAASRMVPLTPADERLSLIFAPGNNSYPIINYEYAMVSKNQNVTGMATALKTFLTWAIDPANGNSPYFLNQVNFIPLPYTTAELSYAQINEITGP